MLGIGDVGTAVSSRVRSFGKKDVSKRKKAFILGGFCTAQVLDVTTTHIGLSQGRQELNGAAACIIAPNGELAVYAIQLGVVAGLVLFLLFFGRRRSTARNAYLTAVCIPAF